MTFTGFTLLCLVLLFGYYVVIILRPKKDSKFQSKQHPFKPTEIVVEPPISVTIGMVSFSPSVHIEEDNGNPPPVIEDDNSSSRYSSYSPISNCSLSDLEIKVFYTREACEAGKQLFSNISI